MVNLNLATAAHDSQAARGAGWVRPLLGALSPAGRRGRLTILIFHRVHAVPDELFPNQIHATTFLERMLWVRNWFNVLPLAEAVEALAHGSLPARSVASKDGELSALRRKAEVYARSAVPYGAARVPEPAVARSIHGR